MLQIGDEVDVALTILLAGQPYQVIGLFHAGFPDGRLALGELGLGDGADHLKSYLALERLIFDFALGQFGLRFADCAPVLVPERNRPPDGQAEDLLFAGLAEFACPDRTHGGIVEDVAESQPPAVALALSNILDNPTVSA